MDPYTERLVREAGWSLTDPRLARPLRYRRAECDRLDVDRTVLADALVSIDGANVVAWDTETWRIAPGRVAPPMVCASFAWRRPDGALRSTLLDRPTAIELLRMLLRRPEGPTLVAHNGSFDAAVLIAAAPDLEDDVWRAYDAGKMRCTMIRELLLAVAAGEANRRTPAVSLSACVERHLHERVEGKGADSWRTRYHELDSVPLKQWPEEARRYAELDARYCLRVYEEQDRVAADMTEDGMIPDEVPQTQGAWGLHLNDCWGLRCDPGRVDAYEASLEERIERARPVLEEQGWLVNGSVVEAAVKQAVRIAYDAYDLGYPALTDTGETKLKKAQEAAEVAIRERYVSIAGDVLRTVPCLDGTCTEDGPCGEPLHILADRKDAALGRSRYLKHLRRGCSEVVNARTSPVLSTGRAAISKPPLQQWPRKGGARECFAPRRGWLYIGADFEGAEMVTLAQVLLDVVGYSELAEALLRGLDPHIVTAADLLGIDYLEAEQRKAAGDKKVKDARQLSKALNFGLPGGMGPDAFVRYAWKSWGVRVEVVKAKALKERWLELYPEVREYFASVSAAIAAGGGAHDYVQPYSGRLRGAVEYCALCNTAFQGLAADAAKAALYRVQRECWTGEDYSHAGALFGARPVIFVHDEIIAEAQVDRAADAAERLSVIMVEELALRCPDLAPACRAEPWISDRWSKEVESVRDDQGRLIPWEPRT